MRIGIRTLCPDLKARQSRITPLEVVKTAHVDSDESEPYGLNDLSRHTADTLRTRLFRFQVDDKVRRLYHLRLQRLPSLVERPRHSRQTAVLLLDIASAIWLPLPKLVRRFPSFCRTD